MRTAFRAFGVGLAACAALSTAGCLDDDLPVEQPGGASFIALQRDFQEFRGWERFAVGETPVPPGHPSAGRRFAYLSARPPAGATSFPVGTIIVKAVEEGAPQEWVLHAMVKRGGGFNAGGASGWEWFDLEIDAAENALVIWRGYEPPDGQGYGGEAADNTADCNSCHAAGQAFTTDYVLSTVLAPANL